jgi:hypothetical protein
MRQGLLQNDYIINENAIIWWKYAIKWVLRLQKEKKGMINAFKMSSRVKNDYQKRFMKQFGKYLNNKTYHKNELQHIIISIEQKDLEQWVTVLTKKRIQAARKKEVGLLEFWKRNISFDADYEEIYDFRNNKASFDNNPVKEDNKLMVVDIKITSFSMYWHLVGEPLAEIVWHDMAIGINKFISCKNIIDISASTLWIFNYKWNKTGFKQVIAGPIGWANSVKIDGSFYKFGLANNEYLNRRNFDKSKSINAQIILHNGEKEISFNFDNLKLFLKLNAFMLLSDFFKEGRLPEYDIDLPNQCKLISYFINF